MRIMTADLYDIDSVFDLVLNTCVPHVSSAGLSYWKTISEHMYAIHDTRKGKELP